MFTRACHWSLRQIATVHHLPSYLFKINFNIILPSMPRFFKWFCSFTFHQQNPVDLCSSRPYTSHAPPISFSMITSPEEYYKMIITHEAPHYAIFSSPFTSSNFHFQLLTSFQSICPRSKPCVIFHNMFSFAVSNC
jgi:hypothetical protein